MYSAALSCNKKNTQGSNQQLLATITHELLLGACSHGRKTVKYFIQLIARSDRLTYTF